MKNGNSFISLKFFFLCYMPCWETGTSSLVSPLSSPFHFCHALQKELVIINFLCAPLPFDFSFIYSFLVVSSRIYQFSFRLLFLTRVVQQNAAFLFFLFILVPLSLSLPPCLLAVRKDVVSASHIFFWIIVFSQKQWNAFVFLWASLHFYHY